MGWFWRAARAEQSCLITRGAGSRGFAGYSGEAYAALVREVHHKSVDGTIVGSRSYFAAAPILPD